MNAVYLPQIEFESKNRFFYTYYTAKEEYIYHNVLQYHDFYEIQLFQSKIQDKEEILGYITLSDKKYPITHNALVLINIFEQHKVEVTSENYIRFCIDVMPDFIYFVSSAETNLLNFFQKSTSSPLRILDTKQSEQLIQLFYDFGEPKISNGYDIYKKGVLCMLIAHLFDICYTNFYSSAYYEDKNITLIFEIIQSSLTDRTDPCCRCNGIDSKSQTVPCKLHKEFFLFYPHLFHNIQLIYRNDHGPSRIS